MDVTREGWEITRTPELVSIDLLPPLVKSQMGVDMLTTIQPDRIAVARRILTKKATDGADDPQPIISAIRAAFVEAFA